jgi:hypothetical protein
VLLAFATFDYIAVPLSWCTAMVKPFLTFIALVVLLKAKSLQICRAGKNTPV